MPDTIGHIALENLSNAVKKISLPLATLLASPVSSIAISLLASAFGVDESNLNDLTKKISEDPEAAFKIRRLLLQHETALAKIDTQNFQSEVEDRKSAREREVNLKDHVPTILAVGFLINYAMIQFYCVTHPASEIDIISARFQDVLIMIMSYYFGSAYKNFNQMKT